MHGKEERSTGIVYPGQGHRVTSGQNVLFSLIFFFFSHIKLNKIYQKIEFVFEKNCLNLVSYHVVTVTVS